MSKEGEELTALGVESVKEMMSGVLDQLNKKNNGALVAVCALAIFGRQILETYHQINPLKLKEYLGHAEEVMDNVAEKLDILKENDL